VKSPNPNDWIKGLPVLAAIIGVAWFFLHDSDKSEATAKSPEKENAEKICASDDDQCIFDKNWIQARKGCRPLIEKSAQIEAEWTDGVISRMFTRYSYNAEKQQMNFIGDKVKFRNSFNAQIPMTYICTFDLKNQKITNFSITEGKL
jgi:hypothetical protein